MNTSRQSIWKSKNLEIGKPPSPPLVKRKTMTARTYKSLFKRLPIKDTVPDVDGELEQSDKQSYCCSDNNMGIVSEPMEQTADVSEECIRRVVGQLGGKSIDKASAVHSQKVTGGLRGYENDILENGTNMDPNLMENVVDETPGGGGLEDLRNSSGIREIFDDSERLPPNCSTKNKDTSESERATCLRRSPDDTITAAESKNCSLLGICVLCFKEKRISYNSQEKELCSCDATGDDLDSSTNCKDRGDPGAAVALDSAENSDDKNPLKETHSDCQRDCHENVCAVCNKDGELLCCKGKDCKRCYHLCCIDPPMTDILPGIWHCPHCVNKKLKLGIHSVSRGVESVWDVREVEVPNAKGNKQRQYLVKYQGLAHIHNHWLPEKQLLLENPSLV
ncbi:DNA helicase [Handroanthus impetiginosus]|uniref:DNA helicase n=1 Tax=Handroanthus impetiginosus TaxID=429701 RepID=A0A2G9GR07_9LAMI|nr:DNA helicase [Handroanthus impetiginosus]